MILYLDTSALVKLYVEEDGSSDVRTYVQEAEQIATSRVAYAEARAAFARRHREGVVTSRELRHAVATLDNELDTFITLELATSTSHLAGQLAEQHALRGFDAIHLASALELAAMLGDFPAFACFDERLTEAARRSGLPVQA